MGGYCGMYVIGKLGGFLGSDGVNPIQFQLWEWINEREGLSVHYVDNTIRPIGKIRFVLTGRGQDEVLDACIAFYPDHFRSCPSLAGLEKALADEEICDVHAVPGWSVLREEARPKFKDLHIWKADFQDWPS